METKGFTHNPLESVSIDGARHIAFGNGDAEARCAGRGKTGVDVEAGSAGLATSPEQAEVVTTPAQSGALAESADRVRPVSGGRGLWPDGPSERDDHRGWPCGRGIHECGRA